MRTTYLIAKYVDDLSRNEPKNVGIVVSNGQFAKAVFHGEVDGRVNLGKVRGMSGSRTYRQWVEHWRRALEEPAALDASLDGTQAGEERAIERLLLESGPDFYLERGGSLILDQDDRTLEEVAADLFAKLVHPPDPPSVRTLRERSYEVLEMAGAPTGDEDRFKVDYQVELAVGDVNMPDELSFAVKNGNWHALQEVNFSDKARVTRDEVKKVLFFFEHVPENWEQHVVLYNGADIVTGQYKYFEALRGSPVTVVNVAEPEKAATTLHERLHFD